VLVVRVLAVAALACHRVARRWWPRVGLRGSKATLDQALDAMRAGLVLLDAKGRAQVWNQRLLDLFLDSYTQSIPGKSRPYPGVLDAIERFENAGYLLAICTNKYEANSLALIEALGLSGHFAANCGQDTFPFRKPDPRHLIETIKRAGGDPAVALMVGDSQTDIDTAKAAGIPVAAVDFGYTDRHVREFDPSVVISHFNELTLDLAHRLISAAQ